jgi:uncharacterized membrane protein
VRGRLRAFAETMPTGFWAIPTLFVLLVAELVVALVGLDRTLTSEFGGITFGAGADGAREVLSAVTTSMITCTGRCSRSRSSYCS